MKSLKTMLFIVALVVLMLSTGSIKANAAGQDGQVASDIKGAQVQSIDEMPLPDDAKAMGKDFNRQMKTKGYIDASDEEVGDINNFKNDKPKHIDEAKKEINFKHSSSSHFSAYKSEGAVAHGVADGSGKSNMLTQTFTAPDGTVIQLQEIDFTSTSGGGAILDKDAINQSVNGYPAAVVIRRSPKGKTLSELIWHTETKGYTLRTTADARKKKVLEDLLNTANSIGN